MIVGASLQRNLHWLHCFSTVAVLRKRELVQKMGLKDGDSERNMEVFQPGTMEVKARTIWCFQPEKWRRQSCMICWQKVMPKTGISPVFYQYFKLNHVKLVEYSNGCWVDNCGARPSVDVYEVCCLARMQYYMLTCAGCCPKKCCEKIPSTNGYINCSRWWFQ